MTYGTLEERYWAKVDVRGPDECWPWTAGLNRKGYGKIREAGAGSRWFAAHRFAWALAFGPIPTGLMVCHRCDNPPCQNPHHLFLGTARDNNADRDAKGRGNYLTRRGAANGLAKLTQEQVEAMRSARSTGVRVQVLAEQYGIDPSTAYRALSGERYRS